MPSVQLVDFIGSIKRTAKMNEMISEVSDEPQRRLFSFSDCLRVCLETVEDQSKTDSLLRLKLCQFRALVLSD